VPSTGLFSTHHAEIAQLAMQTRLPTVFGDGDLETGGLISYGARLPDMFNQLGTMVAKILSGTNPADLPVQQPTSIPFKINLRTAKTLGLSIPQQLLIRADEVIE